MIFAFASVANGTAPAAVPVSIEWFNPFALHLIRRLHRGDPALAVHLLGLGHLPRAQRGDEGPEAHPRACGADLDARARHHLRARRGRRDLVRGHRLRSTDQDDVFLVVKDALFGPWAWLLVLAVMISAISSTQTTILPTARGTLSMAIYRALPSQVRDRAPEVPHARASRRSSWAPSRWCSTSG